MGRRKIEIQRIGNESLRRSTFVKRRFGLFKKAMELSLLTGCEIALVVFDMDGKCYQYASQGSINNTLVKFMDIEPVEKATDETYFEEYVQKGDQGKQGASEGSTRLDRTAPGFDTEENRHVSMRLPDVQDMGMDLGDVRPAERIEKMSERLAATWSKNEKPLSPSSPGEHVGKENYEPARVLLEGMREDGAKKRSRSDMDGGSHHSEVGDDEPLSVSLATASKNSTAIASKKPAEQRKRKLRVSIPEKNSAPPTQHSTDSARNVFHPQVTTSSSQNASSSIGDPVSARGGFDVAGARDGDQTAPQSFVLSAKADLGVTFPGSGILSGRLDSFSRGGMANAIGYFPQGAFGGRWPESGRYDGSLPSGHMFGDAFPSARQIGPGDGFTPHAFQAVLSSSKRSPYDQAKLDTATMWDPVRVPSESPRIPISPREPDGAYWRSMNPLFVPQQSPYPVLYP
uniref:MADS-box domain-containing protein n=1 Tax=Palpitomonas bilix TaxID=652834 RepID=A0A7S3LUT5_9EUKA|mmetsp:Transcript_47429/g.122711  ORF Transcript_47429/g.122711 Transcript_47429/m.122711 type:complete len:457 (+) Transcript_47429:192-1562(+)